MDLESKLSFTHTADITSSNVDDEILKDGISLANDPFMSIDEREEFGKSKMQRKGSMGGNSTDKSKKVVYNNFTKKLQASDSND